MNPFDLHSAPAVDSETNKAHSEQLESNTIELKTATSVSCFKLHKEEIQKFLFIYNLISFVITTIVLIASFSEVIQECIVLNCDLSVSYVTEPICEYDDSIEECLSIPNSYSSWALIGYHAYGEPGTCDDMIADYGCNCEAISSCDDIIEKEYPGDGYGDYGDDIPTDSSVLQCKQYSCYDYCHDFCVEMKYVLFILVVLFEFFAGIPLLDSLANEWDDQLDEENNCYYKCCCKSKSKAKMLVKMLVFISQWMVNFSLYSFKKGLIPVAHMDWIIVGLFVMSLCSGMSLYNMKTPERRCCNAKNLCNLMNYASKTLLISFGIAYTFFFVIMFGVYAGTGSVLFSFNVLFDFDFKIKLFISLHTICVLMTQLVSYIRYVFEDCIGFCV